MTRRVITCGLRAVRLSAVFVSVVMPAFEQRQRIGGECC
jgi:hypothetical protein